MKKPCYCVQNLFCKLRSYSTYEEGNFSFCKVIIDENEKCTFCVLTIRLLLLKNKMLFSKFTQLLAKISGKMDRRWSCSYKWRNTEQRIIWLMFTSKNIRKLCEILI